MLSIVLNYLTFLFTILIVKECFRIAAENKKLSRKIKVQEELLLEIYCASVLYQIFKENSSITETLFPKDGEFTKISEKLKMGEFVIDDWKIKLDGNIAVQVKNWIRSSISEVEEKKRCPVFFKEDLEYEVSTMVNLLEALQQELGYRN